MQTQFEELTDTQWQIIEQTLEAKRKRKYSLRSVVNGLLHILRTGCQWRNLPKSYPKWELVYYYFRKWSENGSLDRLSSQLNQKERHRQGKAATPSLLCIDSQSIKSAPFIKEAKGIDGNKKINGRKRHLLVDTLGLVWGVVVHGADLHDGTQAHLLVEHCVGYLERMQKILVDDAYKQVFIPWVESHILGLEVEVASRPPTEKGFVPVKWRWVNERTFGWFNFFRRLSKDYEKTAKSAQAWILWVNCQIILNRC